MSKEIQKHIQHFFQVQDLLGSGAYGHVWKVQQKSTKKTYALKKVFDAFQNNIDAQRTYREITILHQLDNPHIVKLKSVIKAKNDKDLYLVFEHMETDLHSIVGENILEMAHLLYIIYQIFKALKYLHSAQLVHRDLKPSNILINSECEIKLCDFGLVRSLAHEESERLVLSQDVATRWYRSPEMLLGSEEYDWATDVWSVGCILAELIIGEPLLMGGSNIEQLQKILELTGIPKSQDIQSIRSSVGEDLINQFNIIKKPFRHYFKGSKFEHEKDVIDLIKSMLEFNPNKRITVDEVLNHPLLAELRCLKEEVICKRFVVPEIDDNVRLSVEEYRKAIYKDVERRYPEYNKEDENERNSSLFRLNRGHNSLMNRAPSIDSFPRAKASNSLIRQTCKKEGAKKPVETPEIHNHSLHCNTAHNSNFYKAAVSDQNSMNHKGHNSLYYRKNPFRSILNNQKSDNKDSTDVSTLIQKSPYRRYKKSNEKSNPIKDMERILGLTRSVENSLQKVSIYEKKQNFVSYLPSATTKSKLLRDTSKNNVKEAKFDPAQVYSPTSPKLLKKKEKNLYKIAQVSNENKITKKTFTRARKQLINQIVTESKNASVHNNFSGAKLTV